MCFTAVRDALQVLSRLDLYRVRQRIGLSAILPSFSAMIAILIGASLGGCGMTGRDGPFAQMDSSDFTGSIAAVLPARDDGPTEADLALARIAASDVLTKGDKDSSQPWENPATGARGSVTPLAAAYSNDGRTCRDFLASYVKDRTESWMQGAACRTARGHWEIRALKPWRRG
ncbi:surface antigen [Rhodopseudomonas thermotolerans]|uniref:Surface antigen n=3 Tax=Nitrobacteraceae TaxID=41294 RepID=A0A336JLH2_9BRAD|nr:MULTISPECIES: RT0821/Lpp0805 family surface protein [Rhodopseudomonas]RED37581.1 surface antigen [Rhodopseudomonas pentothenatexigens]REG04067.1 surface antigen [Rhodopseudomonas thermotolerans]SSW90548.1 surface antigen [Rhodopseudomonas pentothenatexigens]